MASATKIQAAIVAVLGILALGYGPGGYGTAYAGTILPPGNYEMTIDVTPGGTNFGSAGNWESGLYMGCLPGTSASCAIAMGDSTPTAGDGRAGVVDLQVTTTSNSSVNNIKVTSFQVDDIVGTPLGTLAQYVDYSGSGTSLMSGTVDATGLMNLTPTGRFADASLFPILNHKPWNANSGVYDSFTTGTASNPSGSINGNEVTLSVIPGKYSATLVSAGTMSSDWGGFWGAHYFEIWNSQTTITFVSPLDPVPVPEPSAFWLLASGLIGLAGLARKPRI